MFLDEMYCFIGRTWPGPLPADKTNFYTLQWREESAEAVEMSELN